MHLLTLLPVEVRRRGAPQRGGGRRRSERGGGGYVGYFVAVGQGCRWSSAVASAVQLSGLAQQEERDDVAGRDEQGQEEGPAGEVPGEGHQEWHHAGFEGGFCWFAYARRRSETGGIKQSRAKVGLFVIRIEQNYHTQIRSGRELGMHRRRKG